MPGRQAHGRSLLAAPKPQAGRKGSKARSQKNALNAFGIAQERFPTKTKRTPRARELDAQIERKHGRDGDEDDEEDEGEGEEEEGPQRKKVKKPSRQANQDGDVEFGSDSEGNEWQLGGMADGDEDSEIESDDAFGDSDEDKFEGYSFGGSKQRRKKDDMESDEEDDDDSQDDQGETLGEEAIDLATALDQSESESDQAADEPSSASEDDDEEEDSEEDDTDEEDDEEDSEADPERLEALQGLVSEYGGQEDDSEKQQVSSKPKIDLSDLGLSGISDPHMKHSLKLMKKEDKEKRPGQSKKLEVPLARREQAKLDRSAAYSKTNETLARWADTVKHNRRAEHLVFPLPENSESYGVDRMEIQPLTMANPGNELESTIMSIMEQSGLSMNKPEKPKEKVYDDDGNELSRKQILNQKRLERELNSREAKRTARIKKIKSKAYHRVHRKQRERDDMATREAMEEAGEIDSEAEREAQDRRRALERVGQRHKESKWAKMGNKNKRAVWDDDFRTGLTEMARKDEELRRRKEGKVGDSDHDESSSGDSDEDEDAKLRRQLDELDADEDDEPHSKLMGLRFMQRGEAAKKKANDDLVEQIRRDLDGDVDDDDDDDEEDQGGEVGRKSYGRPGVMAKPALDTSKRASKQQSDTNRDGVPSTEQLSSGFSKPDINSSTVPAPSTAGAWSSGAPRRKTKSTPAADLDLTANILVASQAKPKSRSKPAVNKTPPGEEDSDATSSSGSDSESDSRSHHHPLSIRDTDLISRAFASDDVYAPFAAEKASLEAADAPQTVDTTLPGWGSWVGDGLSAREQKRNAERRFTKTVPGLDPSKRKDRGMDRVIINEKRIKKNGKFLAGGLPHPFETREQYERSLRLPVGREWMTKEVVQDGTKPRVLVGQGIITPMARPTR